MKGVFFALDLVFAIAIALSLVYLLSSRPVQYHDTVYSDNFPESVFAVNSAGRDDYIPVIFNERMKSGHFDNITIGSCSNKGTVYRLARNGHELVYCDNIQVVE